MIISLQEQKIYIFTDNYLDNQRFESFTIAIIGIKMHYFR